VPAVSDGEAVRKFDGMILIEEFVRETEALGIASEPEQSS